MIADITYLDYQIPFFFEWKSGIKYKVCRKGRRAGITKGAANAVIEWLLDGNTVLWGETTHGNIERYFDRYFLPVLKDNNIKHRFDRQKKQLNIGRGFCDFRSEDNPENWEGFAYNFIFLNEAGIILKNRDLYVNSVLPMLLDFPDSKLIAAGVPKGKVLKDGTEHPFYTLYKRAEDGNQHYEAIALTSYDNPILGESDIQDLEVEIELFSPDQVRQEIYGEFIETDALNPFFTSYLPEKHESSEAKFLPGKQIVIMMDFNHNPFAVTFSHVWRDERGWHDHQFDEMAIKNGSVPEMIDRVKERYGAWLHSAMLSGDAMGNRGQLSERDYASIYLQVLRGWNMSQRQLRISGNPTHENSRADSNFVLHHHPDVKINPETCPLTCREMRTLQCDGEGKIIKQNRNDFTQRGDFADNFRYKCHNFHRDFIRMTQNRTSNKLHLQS